MGKVIADCLLQNAVTLSVNDAEMVKIIEHAQIYLPLQSLYSLFCIHSKKPELVNRAGSFLFHYNVVAVFVNVRSHIYAVRRQKILRRVYKLQILFLHCHFYAAKLNLPDAFFTGPGDYAAVAAVFRLYAGSYFKNQTRGSSIFDRIYISAGP